jgi:HAD superfamily hydrolase (TIGR01509 family)
MSSSSANAGTPPARHRIREPAAVRIGRDADLAYGALPTEFCRGWASVVSRTRLALNADADSARRPDADAAMTVVSAASDLRAAARLHGRHSRPRRPRQRSVASVADVQRIRPFELETVTMEWQAALDAAEVALGAAKASLPAAELARGRRDLARERELTADALAQLAQATGVRPAPWLSPVPVTRTMLGLAATVDACLFDLDGVLTDSAVLHAEAWADVLDDFLLRLSEKTGWHFIPFDRDADYRQYLDGRPRLEGVHAFLESRGIHLPAESRGDVAERLAQRKYEALERHLRVRGVTDLPGARRYLEAAGRAGVRRAVISASARTSTILELATLAALVDARIDAGVIEAEGLRSRPAPDLLLAACEHLGVRPEQALSFTHSAAGVAAAHAAGVEVVVVGDKPRAEQPRTGEGSMVTSLNVLLDRRLTRA